MTRTPAVLIHGTWLHTTSWQSWTRCLLDAGFGVEIPSWPGESSTAAAPRQPPGAFGELGLRTLLAHHERIVRSLPVSPVVIGHSVGGLIAQHLLAAGLARAAVGIASVPTDTVAWAAPPLPGTPDPLSALTARQFRRLFATTTDEHEAARLFERFAAPAPRRLLTDLGMFAAADRIVLGTDVAVANRGPLLLISGQEDRVVTDATVRANYKLYGDSSAVTELKQFPDRGHSLVVDSGWRTVADHVVTWLAAQGISP